jgi:hypothetical protein
MLLSLETVVIVGAFVVSGAGATLLCRNRSGASSPAGVEEHAQTDNGGSPGTWEILSSPQHNPGGSYRETNSRPLVFRRWREGERNNQRRLRYRQAKATKRGGTDGRKSQRLDSTVEAGELRPEDPGEGSEASVDRLSRGNHAEHIEVRSHVPVTRLNGIGTLLGAAVG